MLFFSPTTVFFPASCLSFAMTRKGILYDCIIVYFIDDILNMLTIDKNTCLNLLDLQLNKYFKTCFYLMFQCDLIVVR